MSPEPRFAAAFAGLLFVLATAAAGCEEDEPRAPADQAAVEKAVQGRMSAIKHCWKEGDKKSSYLEGEVQKLLVDVMPSGKVRITFDEDANARHPVGACVRSALDGLRFAPQSEEERFVVDVRLGKPRRR